MVFKCNYNNYFKLSCRGGARGRVQGVHPPPPETKPCSSYSLLKFVHLTSKLHHSLVVHPLVRKILDPPLSYLKLPQVTSS